MADDNRTVINVVPMDQVTDRFDRLEKKMDKMADAMVSLARTEEKIMHMEADRATLNDRVNRHSEKLDELQKEVNQVDKSVAENSRITANIVKITWVVVSTLVAGAIKLIFFV